MISVIIPMFNAEGTITRALDSILNQTWKGEFEVIVVNDGSTDDCRAIVENYISRNPAIHIQLMDQENQGVSKARNEGMKIAKGSFIALLDADDEWLPEKTEIQMSYFAAHARIDLLATRRNNKKLLFPYASKKELVEVTLKKLLIRNEITAPSVIFKRKILDNTGFFQEDQNHAEDVDYYLRISANNRMFIVNQSLVTAGSGKRSFGVSGLSANLKKMAEGYQKNIDRLFVAKRINRVECYCYKAYNHLKYSVLLLRNSFQKKQ